MILLILITILFNAAPNLTTAEPVESKIEINQQTIQTQSHQSGGSTLSLSITNKIEGSGGSFPGGGQPIIPALMEYRGPWKEGWNIIGANLFPFLERYWLTKEAKEALKGGKIIKSLFLAIPHKTPLVESKGVNVFFANNTTISLPPSAIPLGIVIIKGGKETTLVHLVARAVLESQKRNASWLKIERYDFTNGVISSSLGIGLCTSGNGYVGEIPSVGGIGGGNTQAMAYTITEPFIQGIAYGLLPSKPSKSNQEGISNE